MRLIVVVPTGRAKDDTINFSQSTACPQYGPSSLYSRFIPHMGRYDIVLPCSKKPLRHVIRRAGRIARYPSYKVTEIDRVRETLSLVSGALRFTPEKGRVSEVIALKPLGVKDLHFSHTRTLEVTSVIPERHSRLCGHSKIQKSSLVR